MITHRAGLPGPGYRPGRGELRQPRAGLGLDIDQRIGREPVVLLEQPCGLHQRSGGERRVQEHDVEGLRGSGQKAESIAVLDSSPRRLPLREPSAKFLCRHGIPLDKRDMRCSARKRLQTQCAAAGEQVQAAGSPHARCKPVEQGLAHAIGRWTNLLSRRETQFPAAPNSPDDSQLARMRGADFVSRTPAFAVAAELCGLCHG